MTQLKEAGNIHASINYFENFNIDKTSQILDIGTRFGTFINILNQNGYLNVYGIDINDKHIKQGKKTYPHLNKCLSTYDGKSLPFEDQSIDVITMFDVIEHIPNVDVYLHEVNRVLKPAGSFIFQTPNKYINIIWQYLRWKNFRNIFIYHCSLQTSFSLKKY